MNLIYSFLTEREQCRETRHMANFGKNAFEKAESIFVKNSLVTFTDFSKLKNFLISGQKTSPLRWERHFSEISSIDTHSKANFPRQPILKNPSFFFFKKPKYWTFREISYFSRILRQICYKLVKKISRSEVSAFVPQTLSIDKHRVKKRRIGRFEWMSFLPFCFGYFLKWLHNMNDLKKEPMKKYFGTCSKM